ncbi:MAG: amidase domain-containing protein [Eubacteriaceae bacterium]|nr:amidase domain-containing protein [Eubacteriaceae bacterium]
MIYDRKKAVEYAQIWALGRNPNYYNFNGIGGDCTNFVSQCIFAGSSGIMNYTKDTGWFYNSSKKRAAAWSGVEYLHKFLTTNTKAGPHGTEMPLEYAEPGDIIQLSYDGNTFGHSLFIVSTKPEIIVAQHSSENYVDRPFSTYQYQRARLIHIDGVRIG